MMAFDTTDVAHCGIHLDMHFKNMLFLFHFILVSSLFFFSFILDVQIFVLFRLLLGILSFRILPCLI